MSKRKTFRLFVSSTFVDFKVERDILRKEVFPEVKKYYEERGFTFQPIDLRWGVNQEAQLDQRTLEICLNEVRSCKTYPHPNFLVMLGDRYGWIPLPFYIEQTEFEQLLIQCAKDDVEILKHWYRLDQNQLPPSYILRERRGEAESTEEWGPIESQMRIALQQAAKKVLDKVNQKKYFQSATEAEIMEGIFPYLGFTEHQKQLAREHPELSKTDANHVFGFFRSVEIQEEISLSSNIFIGADYEKAQRFKSEVAKHIPPENNLTLETIQKDSESLITDYHSSFVTSITEFLKSQIEIHQTTSSMGSHLVVELIEQESFAKQKRKNFLGRETILGDIEHYIQNETSSPLLIYGPSGRGKSAIIAKAIERAEKINSHQIVYRFVAASPESSSSKAVLKSILEELKIPFEKEASKMKVNGNGSLIKTQKEESFEDFSYHVFDAIMNIKVPTIIFLDALDQLSNRDYFLWLPEKLPLNIKIILSALDDEEYIEDREAFEFLKSKTNNLLEIPPFYSSDGIRLVNSLLAQKKRQLQNHQIFYFIKQFEKVLSPLYIEIAVQELQYWKSYDSTPLNKTKEFGRKQYLSDNQKGIVKEYIKNLSNLHHHDKNLVNRILGCIWSSKESLSEYELLRFLNADTAFVDKIASTKFNHNISNKLPIVLWARFYSQLKPFLGTKEKNGQESFFFFHREFRNAVKELSLKTDGNRLAIINIHKIIWDIQNQDFHYNRWSKVYLNILLNIAEDNKLIWLDDYVQVIHQLNKNWTINFIELINSEINYEDNENNFSKLVLYSEIYRKYSSILYDIDKELWDETFLISLYYLSGSYMLYGKTKEAIPIAENLLDITTKLHNLDSEKWSKNYMLSLNLLAQIYSRTHSITRAVELGEISCQILENLHAQDNEEWANSFCISLNNLADYYLKKDKVETSIFLNEKAYRVVLNLYKSNPNKYNYSYLHSLLFLAESYRFNKKFEKGIKLELIAYRLVNKLYETNSNRWVEDYCRVLLSLATSYNGINQVTKSLYLEKKTLIILEGLYERDSIQWAPMYVSSLINLCGSYLGNNQLIESISIGEKAILLLEKLYSNQKNRWASDYLTAHRNLVFSYYNHGEISKSILMQRKALNITAYLYQVDEETWVREYVISLRDLASAYEKIQKISFSIFLEKKALNILFKLYKVDVDKWSYSYSLSLYKLAYYLRKKNVLSFNLQKESLRIQKDLFEKDKKKYARAYLNSLNGLSSTYAMKRDIKNVLLCLYKTRKILIDVFGKNCKEMKQTNLEIAYFEKFFVTIKVQG